MAVDEVLLAAEVVSLPEVVALPEAHPGAEAEAAEGSVAEEAEAASAEPVRTRVDSRPGLGLEAVGEVDTSLTFTEWDGVQAQRDRAITGAPLGQYPFSCFGGATLCIETILPRFCIYST